MLDRAFSLSDQSTLLSHFPAQLHHHIADRLNHINVSNNVVIPTDSVLPIHDPQLDSSLSLPLSVKLTNSLDYASSLRLVGSMK
jgi:hypothetical protein